MTRDWMREAHGQARSDKRFAVLLGRWSFPEKYLNPVVRSETDFDLNPVAQPLEPFKAKLLFVNGLRIPQGPGANGGHGQEEGQYLGLGDLFGWNGTWNTKAGRDGSIDRHIARQIGQNDLRSSVTLTLPTDSTLPISYLSWDGDDKPYPGFTKPLDAYDALFARAMLPAPEPQDAQALLAQDKSVLDFVAADVKTLQSRLAGPEREKLDRFTDSLRALERKLNAVANTPQPKCDTPAAPTSAADELAICEANVELATMALICGITHVTALSLGPDNHDANHQDLPEVGTHQTWRLTQAARLYERLEQAGLGDSSLVLYSDACGAIHHGGYEQPYFYFALGGLGGAIRTGRVLESSRYMGDFYAAVATAMGAPTTSFGNASLFQSPLDLS
jgi:hypothetical protein